MIDSSMGYPPNLGKEMPAMLPEIPELDNKLHIYSKRSFMEESSCSVLWKV
jgi:hypothetical protein